MAYLEDTRVVHISFSNSNRLAGNAHCFIYKGRAYKLFQQRSASRVDSLITYTEPTDEAVLEASQDAAEFFSALAWECDARIAYANAMWRYPARAPIKEVKPSMFDVRTLPRGGTVGQSLTYLPCIETDDQRKALALFRETSASNNVFLKFLFYWQVLAVRGNKYEEINNANLIHRRSTSAQLHREAASLPLAGVTIGQYFHDHCRNAIGHVKRDPGRPEIDLDDPVDRIRIHEAVRAVRFFAQEFIKVDLQLTRTLGLFKTHRGQLPEYLPREPPGYRGRLVQPPPFRFRSATKAGRG